MANQNFSLANQTQSLIFSSACTIQVVSSTGHLIPTLIQGPRTRVAQPKMKYWKLHELYKKMKCIPYYEHMPKKFGNLEQLMKHTLRVFPSWGGGKFNCVGLDHSGSQPFNIPYTKQASIPSCRGSCYHGWCVCN